MLTESSPRWIRDDIAQQRTAKAASDAAVLFYQLPFIMRRYPGVNKKKYNGRPRQ